jgi:hypothetical protein
MLQEGITADQTLTRTGTRMSREIYTGFSDKSKVPYYLHSHDQLWQDCPNNSYSSSCKRLYFSVISNHRYAVAKDAEFIRKTKDEELVAKSL